MRDPIAIGLVTAIGVRVALPLLTWFGLAAAVIGTGCLWIAGIRGCLPGAGG